MGARDTTDIDRLLGRRLAMRRTALGMTRGQVAAVAGVSVQQLAKYEAGENRVSASRLVVLAETLGSSVGALLPAGRPDGEGVRLDRLAARIPDPAVRTALTDLVVALAR